MARLDIQMLYPLIQAYLQDQPVEKAWLFGSCSRGEDGPDSDVDIMVRYTDGESLSLFAISKMMCGLSKAIGRKVDLVEDQQLMPFAAESANRDKILIYERAH